MSEYTAEVRELLGADSAESVTMEPWPAPAPLTGGGALPAFPAGALPGAARTWVEATAEATQTPLDLAGSMVLAVASAAALGIAVRVKPGWDEELALYVVCVLLSGERKSAVLREAVRPLRALEAEQAQTQGPAIREARAQRDVLVAQRKRMAADAAKAKPTATYGQVAELDEEIAGLGGLVEPRMFADDATPEALAGLLADHGRIAVLAAESALLDTLAGRYSDGRANLHLVCQAYSGEETRVDRRGHDPEHLARPLLTIGLCVQPHVLAGMVENPAMRDQGFLARCSFFLPTTGIGARQVDTSPVPERVTGAYHAAIRKIAATRDKTDAASSTGGSVGSVATSQGAALTLSPGAVERFRSMRETHEPRLAPDSGDLAAIASWANRLPAHVVRSAAVLHLLAGEETSKAITGETMGDAVALGDYLTAHALAALDANGARAIQRALVWIKRAGADRVSVRDLHRGAFGGHGPVEPVEEACAELARLGYLRRRPNPPPGEQGGRPPSPTYDLNPAILRGDSP